MGSDRYYIEEHRDLSAKEARLIKWLLVQSGHSNLVEQITKASVISKCSCGCPTIDLHVDGNDAETRSLSFSAHGISPENIPVGVILHVRNGRLAELEVYSEDGTMQFSLPEIEKLQIL